MSDRRPTPRAERHPGELARIIATRDEKTGRRKRTQIRPRYHQLDVVRRLQIDVVKHGPGRRYLIQHSAGSGKSTSLTRTRGPPSVSSASVAFSALSVPVVNPSQMRHYLKS